MSVECESSSCPGRTMNEKIICGSPTIDIWHLHHAKCRASERWTQIRCSESLLFQCHPRPLEESKERKQKIGQVGIKPYETPVLCGILETAQKWFQPKIVVGLFYSAPGSPAPCIQRKGVWRAQELKGHANACNSCESSPIIVVALRLWLANVKMLAPCDDTSWVPSKLRTHGPVLTVC